MSSRKTPRWRQQQIAHKESQRQERRQQANQDLGSGDARANQSFDDNDHQDPNGIETRRKKGSTAPRTFAQPSVMMPGDKGIFITTDIGKEKRGCLELGGLVEEYLDIRGLLEDPKVANHIPSSQTDVANDVDAGSDTDMEMDIEAAIASELSTFQTPPITKNSTKIQATQHKPFQLITLDVPCVSFLRFHPLFHTYASIDPVTVVHSICDEAMRTGTMKSRHIRRLVPISWLGKTLADGLARCCNEVLPKHFATSSESAGLGETAKSGSETKPAEEENVPTTFAIRPSIRNNAHIPRDTLIHQVASQIDTLGHGTHKVDLKNYRKGVLVEIYRGWIGMSVVQNENRGQNHEGSSKHDMQVQAEQSGRGGEMETSRRLEFEHGYERLKRFNIAEVYDQAAREAEQEKKKNQDVT